MSSEIEPGTVVLQNVTKIYDSAQRGIRIRDAVPGLRPRPRRPLAAVDAVDLVVRPGETLGLIGPNGAGKSTVLKLVAGVTSPTEGQVTTSGRVCSMIELGLGFHTELTGWENVDCSGVLLGLSRDEVREVRPVIAEFSGIEEALDDPLKTYSLGMRARLGFAVATQVKADILVVDEVLAVGDSEFQLKCLHRISDLAAQGVTVMFVSHDMSLVRSSCERVVQIRSGRIVDDGAAIDVVGRYLSRSSSQYRRSPDAPMAFVACQLAPDVVESWDPVRIEAEVELTRPIDAAIMTVELTRAVDPPEPPFAAAGVKLPGMTQPGRYRLLGTSGPFPGGPGSVNVSAVLVDASRHEVADRSDHVLRVPGVAQPGNMHLAVTPEFSIEPSVVDDPERAGSGFEPVSWGSGEVVVALRGVTKRFAARGNAARCRLALPGGIGRRPDRELTALADLDLELYAGQALGIIGPNGAGKSTLLRILAGVTVPEEGSVRVAGRIVPVLDLGLGFHPDLTGWQNIETSGRLLGMSRADLAAAADDIVEFADIGDVLDVAVKRYSTGMRARLGFALATHSKPDILLVDELLAVGDKEFRRRALDRARTMRDDGVTIVLVSHGLRLIEEVCDRVIWLDKGRLVDDGPASEVVERYGGSSQVAGASDAASGIRLTELSLRRHHVPLFGSIEFKGTLEVVNPSKYARLEISYRGGLNDRDVVQTYQEIMGRTFYLVTLLPSGGLLDAPGRYAFRGSVPDNAVGGQFEVVVSVFDEREQVILSEAWQEASVGIDPSEDGRGRPGIYTFEFTWEVEQIADVEVSA